MDKAVFQSVFVGVGLALGVFLFGLGIAALVGASGAGTWFVAGGVLVVVSLLGAAILEVYMPTRPGK